MDNRDVARAVSSVTHELQARVGAIRLALTTVMASDVDPAVRSKMLSSAEKEALRLSADIAAIGPLVWTLGEASASEPVEVNGLLRRAAADARGAGVDAKVRGRKAVLAMGRPAAIVAGLPALFRIAAAAGPAKTASAEQDGDGVLVRFEGGADGQATKLVRALIGAMGAEPEPSAGSCAFRLPTEPRA